MLRWTTIRERAAIAGRIAPLCALVLVAVAAKPTAKPTAHTTLEQYLSPIEMALSVDGRRLYVVCQGTDELRIVDALPRTPAGKPDLAGVRALFGVSA